MSRSAIHTLAVLHWWSHADKLFWISNRVGVEWGNVKWKHFQTNIASYLSFILCLPLFGGQFLQCHSDGAPMTAGEPNTLISECHPGLSRCWGRSSQFDGGSEAGKKGMLEAQDSMKLFEQLKIGLRQVICCDHPRVSFGIGLLIDCHYRKSSQTF